MLWLRVSVSAGTGVGDFFTFHRAALAHGELETFLANRDMCFVRECNAAQEQEELACGA
jgi:hypothetical protein